MKVVSLFIFLIFTFNITSVYSNNLKNELGEDIRAYCHYIETKNNAKKSLLISPELIVRAQNATNDYPYQNNFITALSKDLADLGKLRQVKALIQDECHYYQLHQEAILHIQYAIPTLQRQALNFKLKSIQAAKSKFAVLLKSVQKKIDSKDDTLMSFYKIDSSLHKFEEAEREIRTALAI